MVPSKNQLWRTLLHNVWEHLVEEGYLAEKGWLLVDLKSSLALPAPAPSQEWLEGLLCWLRHSPR